MKGNEARVIFFLHPVKEFKEGQVSQAKPKSMVLRLRSVLLGLGTLLAIGVLAYVLYRLTNEQKGRDGTSTIRTTTTTTTTTTKTILPLTTVEVTPTPGSQKLISKDVISLPWPHY